MARLVCAPARARRRVLLMCLAALAGCTPDEPLPAGAVDVRPAVVEFGNITDSPIPFHRQRVVLRNGTDHSLVVKRVEKSEGLKVELASGRIVPAGGTGDAVITLNARNRPGAYAGDITFYWESDDPPVTIAVRGMIESGVLATVAGPNLEVVGPRDWDFGTIQRQAVEDYDFTIRNSGTEPLVLTRIETHCGCVQAWADERRLAPGATASIHVRVTARVYPGNTPRKTITIASNDPDTPVTTLLVYGVIEDSFTVEPLPSQSDDGPAEGPQVARGSVGVEGVTFGEVAPGTAPEAALLVRSTLDDPQPATRVALTPENDIVRVERLPAQEGGDVVAAVTLRINPDAPRGPFDLRLQVAFAPESGLATAAIPVSGTVGAALAVVPTAVNFGLVREGEVYHRTLRVPEVSELAALQVACQLNYLRADVQREGGGARVRLTLAPLHGIGTVTGAVVLTDRGTDRTRRIPVAMQFERAAVGN